MNNYVDQSVTSMSYDEYMRYVNAVTHELDAIDDCCSCTDTEYGNDMIRPFKFGVLDTLIHD
jgi:hypothetical protein